VGFDFVLVDLEHTLVDGADLERMIAAADRAGLSASMRRFRRRRALTEAAPGRPGGWAGAGRWRGRDRLGYGLDLWFGYPEARFWERVVAALAGHCTAHPAARR
jgi:hypothetical protein